MTAWYPSPEAPVAGTFVKEHARAVSLYCDVAVIHLAGYDADIRGPYEIQQVPGEDLPTLQVKYRRVFPKTSHLVYLWSAWVAYRSICRQGFYPDIIHAHIYTAALPSIIIGKRYKKPVVVTEQCTVFLPENEERITNFEMMILKHALKCANLILPVSKNLQDEMTSYGIKGRFQVVPNTVNTKLFNPNSNLHSHCGRVKRLLTVALLSEQKGIKYLLHAVTILQRQRNDFHLDIVGDGPMRSMYESIAQDLGVRDKVTFHGLKQKEEIVQFIGQSDIVIMPSLYETFCVVLIEALACGKPVITTHCGGPEEFVTDKVGILVSPRDAAALAKAVLQMFDRLEEFNPSVLAKYAQERFSYETVGALLHSIYESLVAY
jgi:glycosyltransferase involved in cell wall biosynthesis